MCSYCFISLNHDMVTGREYCFAAGALKIAHNTTITLTCCGRVSYPVWYKNGTLVVSDDNQTDYNLRFGTDSTTGDLTSTLVIDGNGTSDPLNFRCTVMRQNTFNTTLIFQGL